MWDGEVIYSAEQLQPDHKDDINHNRDSWDDMAILKAFDQAMKNGLPKKDKQKERGMFHAKQELDKVEKELEKLVVEEEKPIKTPLHYSRQQKEDFSSCQNASDAYTSDTYSSDAYAHAYAKAYADAYAQHHFSCPPNYQSPPSPNHIPHPFSQTRSLPMPMHRTFPPNEAGRPVGPQTHLPSSDNDLSEVLLSWYYSGYYTGRYKAIAEMRGFHSAPRPSWHPHMSYNY